MNITGAAMVAGVVGAPVTHSLSPLIHNAWLAAAGLDGVYAPFACPEDRFGALVEGLRGGIVRGLNVTIPFKEQALALADEADDLARLAGAANVLLFEADGRILARNTDGPGMLGAIAAQAPGHDPCRAPVLVLGAGGAARGAAAALKLAGARVRILNRSTDRAGALARDLGVEAVSDEAAGLDGAGLIINATSLGLGGGEGPDIDLSLAPGAVVMDMVYKPLHTRFLARSRAAGHPTVDGLEMLIRQAVPSFEAFFGRPPPDDVDARALALAALGDAA